MTSRTATKKRAVQDVELQPKEQSAEDVGWATADLLGGVKDYEDTVLPSLNVKVRVRYLATAEIAKLQLLPDYVGFLELAMKFNDNNTDFDPASAAVETVKYHSHVAHRAIVDRNHEQSVNCKDCGDKHPRSLWSLSQTQRMNSDDLQHVVNVSLRTANIAEMRPFSEAQEENDTPEPASSGEPTQQTIS